MRVGQVIGSLWATRKDEALNGLKLLVVQPLHIGSPAKEGVPFVAVDRIGAGVGESVIVVSGSSARNAAGDNHIPVDATVVGIVDDMEVS